ncbi:right-handed parallel beta-helix repeat-containing protein [Staphylococcus xylosus]|uniref:right-handed parallel beta-helix repeat-containing protein n=1 Tax=Staphylococcus xylosus TaxID=1288 RepID=UPI001CDD768D|nr:right-handed parallel beta-helix repeat-containing protein [Staphylococcus xylosus]MCM3518812.1 right-handed parallel beta-helix repeat-containing protein [Staphylococcus xylosus]MCQ3817336.1 right-handed parallel beta-helix repeat-containing protein [Staphylococcus xylosus]MCQ3819968.1 right-handed parallel beta-helix repeat-containing protein [Staphylococcus xylosus]UBV37444.1 right-handed parallel beta-helix repeat-containing protein [Staphylococcus xylosus]
MTNCIYVDKKGSDCGLGNVESPFLTIDKAASVAQPGDSIIVHEGIYREEITHINTGLSESRRISFEAAKDEQVIIKGSEEITGWQQIDGNIWKVEIDNKIFKDFNPFATKLFGDWLAVNNDKSLGQVYLNDQSLFEVSEYEQLADPKLVEETLDHWTNKQVTYDYKNQSIYVWYAKVEKDITTIYVNFHDYNPNNEVTEINVRKSAFRPFKMHTNYITIRNFEIANVATQWSPPTAAQTGMIDTHWSKGWIIENNILYNAVCSAIAIGKEISTGDNLNTYRKDKPGYQYQIETVFKAANSDWNKETIGSHIVRNNVIHDCGQNAVVGHLGSAFSKIYNNHIYNIGNKREFFGYEIAGIKLHAAIDTQVYNNYVHNCSLGMWFDWQTQGTRISKNIFNDNTRDLFIEVSSGPYIVDNNILTADYALDNHAQGGAYVNNIINGEIVHRLMLDRATPYHVPHSTLIAGFAPVYGGDDRFFNNIFIGQEGIPNVGTEIYNGYNTSLSEFKEAVAKEEGDHESFHKIKQPVYIEDNAYFNKANQFNREDRNFINENVNPDLSIVEEGNDVYLNISIPESFIEFKGKVYDTETLPKVRIVDADFEDENGNSLTLNTDLNDELRENESMIGPLQTLATGNNKVKIWTKNDAK